MYGKSVKQKQFAFGDGSRDTGEMKKGGLIPTKDSRDYLSQQRKVEDAFTSYRELHQNQYQLICAQKNQDHFYSYRQNALAIPVRQTKTTNPQQPSKEGLEGA